MFRFIFIASEMSFENDPVALIALAEVLFERFIIRNQVNAILADVKDDGGFNFQIQSDV